MTDHFFPEFRHNRKVRRALSLDDFLLSQDDGTLSDYLSLSLSTCGEHTKITVTTVDAEPVAYSAYVPLNVSFDAKSLVFVAQPLPLGELSDHRSVSENRKACVRIARLAPFWRLLRQKGTQRRR